MSRTDNTMPLRIQEQDGRRYRRDAGGSYEGIGRDTNIAERKARQRVRLILLRGEELSQLYPSTGHPAKASSPPDADTLSQTSTTDKDRLIPELAVTSMDVVYESIFA
ncbi:hypothetical protein ACTWPT_59460 [Nonomuraea sp. 3N208]|uniref:hypothetical protein n=1 Tax=Nonomuraea sp. 3N208 TaxID=3457421 RepID=UPI003FCFA802